MFNKHVELLEINLINESISSVQIAHLTAVKLEMPA